MDRREEVGGKEGIVLTTIIMEGMEEWAKVGEIVYFVDVFWIDLYRIKTCY